uniref:Uncharacterized protein n=1 Tax=Mycena chlorophos TaxID=658473 RepID=A0ABQ0M4S2_MYCCL|nr:predicted protein [Mycena chlorophos]
MTRSAFDNDQLCVHADPVINLPARKGQSQSAESGARREYGLRRDRYLHPPLRRHPHNTSPRFTLLMLVLRYQERSSERGSAIPKPRPRRLMHLGRRE